MIDIDALIERFDRMRDSGVCSPTTRSLLDDAQTALLARQAKITAVEAAIQKATTDFEENGAPWNRAVEDALRSIIRILADE